MESHLLEVKDGVLNTFDGESHRVEGGAYLSPEAYLRTSAELERLRAYRAEHEREKWTAVVLGAALLGFAAGFVLGRRNDE
jgi:hypothetical protein